MLSARLADDPLHLLFTEGQRRRGGVMHLPGFAKHSGFCRHRMSSGGQWAEMLGIDPIAIVRQRPLDVARLMLDVASDDVVAPGRPVVPEFLQRRSTIAHDMRIVLPVA